MLSKSLIGHLTSGRHESHPHNNLTITHQWIDERKSERHAE